MTKMISLLLFSSVAHAAVVKVVVFPDRALVTRTAKVACGTGVRLEMGDLPPAADANSFRAHIDSGSIDGLQISSRARVDAFAARARELDGKIESVNDRLREIADATNIEVYAGELADSYGAATRTLISRELLDGAGNAKAWQAALDHQLEARRKVNAERAKLDDKQRQLRRQLDQLVRQRNDIGMASQERELVAEILVTCPTGEAEVQVTYMVGGASWSPAYEARASDDDASVALTTYATVKQATGEAWTDAHVVLSTALPRQNATPPQIAPLAVYADPRQPPRKVIVSRETYNAHAEISGLAGKKSDARIAIRDQGLSVQMEIPDTVTVAGDGTPARLQIDTTTLKSALFLRSAPRLLPYVFRVAELKNTAPFPLLPGSVDVFRRGSFLARYDIERVAVGARFTLTFGIEDRVKVRRAVVTELERVPGILGPTRRRKFHYRVDVDSYLPKEEMVEIVEQVPVSELDDVKIGLDGSTPGYDLDKADGQVRWRPRMKNGDKQKFNLEFYIDVPASYDSGGN